MNELIKAKVELLSIKPGVYLMKNQEGTIIYVGKAKSLINRVKQYFYRPQEGKVLRMVREIVDFDTIETTSEKEALLLEINLIRKYYPKFNILLKDGKSYPYIALKKKNDPYLKIAYRDNDKNFKYYGPYPNSKAVYTIINLLNKIFPLRKCRTIPNSPCLYYHLGNCLGPCINKINQEDYDNLTNKINSFLNGDSSKIKSEFSKKMHDASMNLEFEKAKEYKEILDGIEEINKKQNIMMQDHIDRDVIAYSSREGYFALSVMTYRKGILLGKDIFVVEIFDNLDEEIENAIFQYYNNHQCPREVIVSSKDLADNLSHILEKKIIYPIRGAKKDMLLIALENAKKGLDEHFLTARLEDDSLTLLEELGNLLQIPTPLHIELFDNSHLQGSYPIGAMVVFINGVKAPSMYRKYNIKNSEGNDDLKSMEEILTRRYSRAILENSKLPDLIIVDGGENQINIALEVIDNLGLSIPVAGLFKNEKHHTSGLIYEQKIYQIDPKSRLFLMLVRMQDEVHRYAISTHRNKRSKGLTSSFLDDIKGLGKKRIEALLKTYPTKEDLQKATISELENIVPKNVAEEIKKKL